MVVVNINGASFVADGGERGLADVLATAAELPPGSFCKINK